LIVLSANTNNYVMLMYASVNNLTGLPEPKPEPNSENSRISGKPGLFTCHGTSLTFRTSVIIIR